MQFDKFMFLSYGRHGTDRETDNGQMGYNATPKWWDILT